MSGHRFGRAGVRGNLPELRVIFTVKWLVSAALNVQLCCMLLLGIDDVIYHFKVALGTEMRQQHCRTENSLALQESCRINLEASFIFQLVCLSLHFSLSFFSISHCHFSLLIYLEVSENCGNPHGSWESPACHRQRWQMAGSSQVLLAVVPVSGLRPGQYLRGYCGRSGITGDTYSRRAGSCLSDKGCCDALLDILCEIGSTAGLHVMPESGMPILILGKQMRRGASAIRS